MADTSETDNDQYDWKLKYGVLRHAYEEKCKEVLQLIFENKTLTWIERIACGLIGTLLTLLIASLIMCWSDAPRKTQAEKDLIHALEAYRNATASENIRHWFKTIGH